MCFSPGRRAISPPRNSKKCCKTVSFFNICTWKCASHHSGVQFFDIGTSKKCSDTDTISFLTFWLGNVLFATASCNFLTTCFVHFDLEMCFSPQPHAMFRHRNFKKWSGADVFCAFSLENVKTACIFWFLLGPHDSFTSLLFDSPDTRIIGKTQHFATSLTLGACVSSFEWLYVRVDLPSCDLTSLVCFSSAFQLSILSEVYHLYKLPSTIAFRQRVTKKESWGLASCHGNLSGRRSGEYSQHATLSMACTGDHDYCGLWRLLPNIFGRREGRERGRTRKTKKTEKFLLAVTGRARIYDLIEWEVILYCSPMHFLVLLKYLKDTHMIPVSRCTRNKRDWSVAVHANCT